MFSPLPGLALAVATALLAYALSPWIPGVGVVVVALILGVVVGRAVDASGRWSTGLGWADRQGLGVAIALLGFGLDPSSAAELGVGAAGALAFLVASTVGLSVLMGRALGLAPPLALLVGVGQAICGTAAIVAVSGVSRSDEEDVGVAIAVINLLGTGALFVLPVLCVLAGLDVVQTSLVLGGSLQSAGHAVAAGYGVSEEVGLLTTAVKMGRVGLLPLLVLALTWSSGSVGGRVRVPPEVVGFVGAALLRSSGLVPEVGLLWADRAAMGLLAIAMAAIGVKMRIGEVKDRGFGALGLAVGLMGVQLAGLAAIVGWLSLSQGG